MSIALSPAQRAALTARRVPSHTRACSGHTPIRPGSWRTSLASFPRGALTSALVSTCTLSLPLCTFPAPPTSPQPCRVRFKVAYSRLVLGGGSRAYPALSLAHPSIRPSSGRSWAYAARCGLLFAQTNRRELFACLVASWFGGCEVSGGASRVPRHPTPPAACPHVATPARRLSLSTHARAPPVPATPRAHAACPCLATRARRLSQPRHARAPPVRATPRARAACPCLAPRARSGGAAGGGRG